jgi:putative OPT family oligopeptide transporter
VFASDVARNFRVGERGVSGYDFFLSFALFGIGHLVGLWVGVAMLVGALIAWVWGVPHFSALTPGAVAIPIDTLAHDTWSHKVRFVGAGTIGVAAIWTLAKLVTPVVAGLRSAMAAARTRAQGEAALMPRTEQDIPIGIVGVASLLCVLPVGVLLAQFVSGSGLGDHLWFLVVTGVLYVAIMSFLVSAVVGYMAGLIGSSNSPLSGIGILTVIGYGLILVFGLRTGGSADTGKALVAYALFVTAVVFAAGSIANNNLQDLKTGQLVDATPWKQQTALVIGVIAGAAIIPPILDLLNRAYGFAGAPGPHHEHPLPAPQAGLISALAQGVIQNNIDWSLIETGGLIGVAVIAADALLRRLRPGAHLSPLAVGFRAQRGGPAARRGDQAARRAARFRHDRRGGAHRSAGRRTRRLLGAGLSAFPGRRLLRGRLRRMARRTGLCRCHLPALPLGGPGTRYRTAPARGTRRTDELVSAARNAQSRGARSTRSRPSR